MQKARRHPSRLRPIVGTQFQGLFHSLIQGSFHLSFTVLVHYRSLRSIQPYQMVLADSDRIPHVPPYSGYCYQITIISSTRLSLPMVVAFQLLSSIILSKRCSPTTPTLPKQYRFGLFPVRSPLLRKSLLFSLPAPTQMFQFSAFAFRLIGMTDLQSAGLPHSESYESIVICTSSQIIAAYHVLLRLSEPRHPPCALSNFLIDFVFYLLSVITSI